MIVGGDLPAPNQCHYCVIAHGAILRIRAKEPRKYQTRSPSTTARPISRRARKAMLDFAMKVSSEGAQDFRSGFRHCCQPRFQR